MLLQPSEMNSLLFYCCANGARAYKVDAYLFASIFGLILNPNLFGNLHTIGRTWFSIRTVAML